jgi:hypothetical protein
MNKYITKINNYNNIFDNKIIDYDEILSNKNIFNIYNNSICEPFHKFWFLLDNTKFINMYYDYNIVRFAINNKNSKMKSIIDYIKNIANYMISIIKEKFNCDNYSTNLPLNEKENYPTIISFQNKIKSIYTHDDKEVDLLNLNQNNTYSVLFEINYIKIINNNNQDYEKDYKFNNNDTKNIILKFKFNIIKIQIENKINISNENLILFNSINNNNSNNINNNINNNNNNNNNNSINNNNSNNINNNTNNKNNINTNNTNLQLNNSIFRPPTADELLNKKTVLKKINIQNYDETINLNKEIEKSILEKKKSLKKIDIIKGDDDYISINYEENKKNNNIKIKKHKKKKNIDKELDKEFSFYITE